MRSPVRIASLLAAVLPLAAHATNGYFSHGYGVKAEGQAGVGIAWAQDALAPATNPAGLAWVGDRIDLGGTLFVPDRGASITGNAFGPDAAYSGNSRSTFVIPEFGYARQLDGRLSAGLAVYGNGGIQTGYAANPYARFGATGTAGVSLEQLFVSPALAWKLTPQQSLGVAANLVAQRFSARGIGAFAAFSADPSHVSDQGQDTSTGAGVRLGWSAALTPQWSAGATWASRVHGRFGKYAGLFADGGRFDVPENYGAGLAFRPAPGWTLGADAQVIRYSRVAAVGDPVASLFAGVPLGAPNGPGFGWRDVRVLKLAVAHRVSPTLELRAGWSHASQPVPQGETFFNILAPGVVQQHFTAGATWAASGGGEWSAFLMVTPRKSVAGAGSIPPGFPPAGLGGGNANLRLQETAVGLAYSWKP